MDRFHQIEQNKYSNFGEDMYGVKVKIPVHSYRSLYSKQPIYFTDYGSPYGGGGGGGYPYGYGKGWWKQPYYAKPPSGGIWAMDGSVNKDAWVADCVKKKLSAIPAGTNFVIDPAIGAKSDCEKEWNSKNSQSSSSKADSVPSFLPKLILPVLGGVAGFFIASANKKDKLTGTLLGIGIVSGGQFLANTFYSSRVRRGVPETKSNASGRTVNVPHIRKCSDVGIVASAGALCKCENGELSVRGINKSTGKSEWKLTGRHCNF